MELDFSGAGATLTMHDILRRISEYDIFERYCSNFKEIDVPFCSELRLDNHPSACIYIAKNNRLYYKDYAQGDHMNCWFYVMAKYGCNFGEAVNIVANDFNLKSGPTTLNPVMVLSNDELRVPVPIKPRPKSNITIVEQPYNMVDYEYWSKYGISLELLAEYNVFSAKVVYLVKGNKRVTFEYNKKNPCYAYRFTRDDQYNYKVYWPLGEKGFKWLFSGGAADLGGYDQLPLHGDVLILTKSLKDCMCYNVLGYPAISLQGEANKLSQELVNELLKRFKKIIINYDNDEQGIKSAKALEKQYGFKSFLVDKHKDLSDYIAVEGLESAKIMIDEKISGYIN